MRRMLMVGALAVAAIGCQTITEELPSRPDAVVVSGGQVPIVVVQVPIPAPQAPPPGGDPAPGPTPRPNPTSVPAPPPGTPAPPGGGSPVARVGIKVYFLERNGQEVPGTENARTALVGDRIHMDCTPRDGSNRPTTAVGTPRWTYENVDIVSVGGNSPYNPVLFARAEGTISMYVTIDGVQSDTVSVEIRRP